MIRLCGPGFVRLRKFRKDHYQSMRTSFALKNRLDFYSQPDIISMTPSFDGNI